MINDPIIDELHAIREQLAAQYNFDVLALGQAYIARQQAENRPVVARPPKPVVLENYLPKRREQVIEDLLTESAA
jgi:hypothetical protein